MKSILLLSVVALLVVFVSGQAVASGITVFHADSLAGPMKELKAALGKGSGLFCLHNHYDGGIG